MKLKFHPEAVAELDDAIEYYNVQRCGLGEEFGSAVSDTIEFALRLPDASPSTEAGARRRRTNRFPYGVVYRVEGDVLVVYGVMHLHRKPGYWIDRT